MQICGQVSLGSKVKGRISRELSSFRSVGPGGSSKRNINTRCGRPSASRDPVCSLFTSKNQDYQPKPQGANWTQINEAAVAREFLHQGGCGSILKRMSREKNTGKRGKWNYSRNIHGGPQTMYRGAYFEHIWIPKYTEKMQFGFDYLTFLYVAKYNGSFFYSSREYRRRS